jgi:hypothetical protein
MKQDDLEQLGRWFEQYVGSFSSDDQVTQNSLKSRYEHTLRTCQEMAYLTETLSLDPPQRLIAQAIALLHDIGRFEQFIRYGTFFDHVSTDHGILGITILCQTGVLSHLGLEEQEMIKTAVKCHNRRALPGDLPESRLLFAQLIRDADKLDIFQTTLDYYRRRQIDPQGPKWELELSDEPTCSSEVVNALLAGQQIAHCQLQTIHDMQLAQIAWIYDVQFAPTYQRLKDRQVLRHLIGLLPEDSPREEIQHKVARHIDAQIEAVHALGNTV